MTLARFVSDKALIMFLSTVSCTIAFGMVNLEIHYSVRRKPRPLRLLQGTVLMTVLLHAPLFAMDYALSLSLIGPLPYYCLFIFPSPLCILPYRWILRRVFGFGASEAMLTIEPVLIGQYFVMVVYMAASDIWAGVWRDASFSRSLPVDISAMLTTILAMAGLSALFFRLVGRKRHFLTPPVGYEERVHPHIAAIVLSVVGNYALLVCIVLFVMSDYREILDISRTVIYIAMAGMLIYRFINGYHANWLRVAEWQRRQSNRYIDELLRATAAFRDIKHDINNILQVYEGYIQSGDIEGLHAYHRSVLRTTTDANASLALLEGLRDRTAVQALFNIKIGQAQGVGVRILVEEAAPLCDVDANDLDLCRVLANLIDNAVEAAALSSDKLVVVRCERGTERVRVTIVNSTAQPVDVERMLADGLSTKRKGGGGGLRAVREILGRMPGCDMGAAYVAPNVELWVDMRAVPQERRAARIREHRGD